MVSFKLGKRKRPAELGKRESSPDDDAEMRARFQRAFEAKFKPLERSKPVETESEEIDEDEDDVDDSDWSGLSDDKDTVEVVDHDITQPNGPEIDRLHAKTFMSSRPPESDSKVQVLPKQPAAPEEDSAESANLTNDLALQRLLKESHLLDPSAFKGTVSAPEGKGRLKVLDLRLQDLGAKQSITQQEKMPLSHRRGIASKAAEREGKRRKEAAENGVVLEKANFTLKTGGKRREKGTGGPTVGKFRGGMLKLSSRDVRSIQGPARDRSKGQTGRRWS